MTGSARRLVHALYTNAPGAGGSGFRLLTLPEDAADAWPAADRRRLEGWLAGLEPVGEGSTEAGAGAAAAATTLRLGGTVTAVLARWVPGFERDAHGRGGGRLVHGWLLPVEEGSDRCLHHAALVAASAAAIDETGVDEGAAPESLDGYLDHLRALGGVDCPPRDPLAPGGLRELLAEERPSVAAVVAAGAAGPGERRPVLPLPVEAGPLPALLAGAGGALPPRLRLAFGWAVGFEDADGRLVTVRSAEGEAPPPAPQPVERYLDRLAALVEAGRAEAARWLDDWEIRSWRELERRVDEEVG